MCRDRRSVLPKCHAFKLTDTDGALHRSVAAPQLAESVRLELSCTFEHRRASGILGLRWTEFTDDYQNIQSASSAISPG
jgi:hypothetical protein